MKEGIHPKNYRPVVFQDLSNGDKFIVRSCIVTSETIKMEDGHEYPLSKVEITNASHPFFTGQQMLLDTAGRVERFNKRFGKMGKKS
ncbi:ribosomal protein L31 [Chloroherpeton thalassium ATCC 35110]|uniref:Large ribosomal subunit protein bL31B n=1 Tax=Chloroherpeton thalassium (strain ATCC 35110 / GB-78) TaxID=517418 RepID=RL31B_CHLT3|nr:type B 50S ribosomal protein L31 [Chloroherpeton thalassium]B3QS57.1 RecName: Full=Large ribosomal subunit protein bL31B; AltName: Full=50S ribosomal protein L31 type B [Chloroherpeton thalassium ATCC 35110]ACF14002.1 ribosomal protein L31 [Chloroherpeton thalassium ATCC 35110]